jgi:hypothetical protein
VHTWVSFNLYSPNSEYLCKASSLGFAQKLSHLEIKGLEKLDAFETSEAAVNVGVSRRPLRTIRLPLRN